MRTNSVEVAPSKKEPIITTSCHSHVPTPSTLIHTNKNGQVVLFYCAAVHINILLCHKCAFIFLYVSADVNEVLKYDNNG